MQFSDTSNNTGLIQDCEFLTSKGDASISGNTSLLKAFTRLINNEYDKLVTGILDSQDGWDYDDPNHTDFPVLEFDLVADQRDYNMALSENVLKFKRLDITYDGVNWYKAEPMDINEVGFGMGNDTTIDGRFDKTEPKYDLKAGNSIWLYPRANQNDEDSGAKGRVEWARDVDWFTTADTTQQPGIPRAFHKMLSLGASLQWLITNKPDDVGLIDRLQLEYDKYEIKMRRFFGKHNTDREYILKQAYQNME